MIALALAAFGLLATGYRPSPGEALSFRGDIPVTASLLASLGYVHALVYGALSIINPPAWSLDPGGAVRCSGWTKSPIRRSVWCATPRGSLRLSRSIGGR